METSSTTPKTREYRTFTEEFKRDAVNLVVLQGYSFKAAAAAVGVSTRSLRDGHEKFAPQRPAAGENATIEELQEENRRLRKQLQRAEIEREILKKATAYFARESE